jgi:hypothetical protein
MKLVLAAPARFFWLASAEQEAANALPAAHENTNANTNVNVLMGVLL